MLFKALQENTYNGKTYAPGEIIPGAATFPNLKELLEHRLIGYAEEPAAIAEQSPKKRIFKRVTFKAAPKSFTTMVESDSAASEVTQAAESIAVAVTEKGEKANVDVQQRSVRKR